METLEHHSDSSNMHLQGPKPDLGLAWYGTRYGHNLAEQVKQHMIDLNISSPVTSLHYHNCTGNYAALRVKVDFDDFPMDPYFKVFQTLSAAFC